MKKILIIGAGGHAKVLIDALLVSGHKIEGILDQDKKLHGKSVLGIKVLGGDELLEKKYPKDQTILVNGVGSISDTEVRQKIFSNFKKKGFEFMTVIHPSSVIAKSAKLGEGVQVLALSFIGADSTIGANVIVNTKVSIDHDCDIAAHVHLAPGVTLSGLVEIGEAAHIGTGASVIQAVTIGKHSLVAAGAVVVSDVANKKQVAGVPAKKFKKG